MEREKTIFETNVVKTLWCKFFDFLVFLKIAKNMFYFNPF